MDKATTLAGAVVLNLTSVGGESVFTFCDAIGITVNFARAALDTFPTPLQFPVA